MLERWLCGRACIFGAQSVAFVVLFEDVNTLPPATLTWALALLCYLHYLPLAHLHNNPPSLPVPSFPPRDPLGLPSLPRATETKSR